MTGGVLLENEPGLGEILDVLLLLEGADLLRLLFNPLEEEEERLVGAATALLEEADVLSILTRVDIFLGEKAGVLLLEEAEDALFVVARRTF